MCDLDRTIESCINGDRKAAEKIYRTFSAEMFAVCLRYSANRQEAEDALQDGFIRLYGSLRQYQGKGSFVGWMKRIFINICLGNYRKMKIYEPVEDLPEQEEVPLPEGPGLSADILRSFISELPEKYRMVFNLYVMEELSHKEISTMLGISEGTSKSNLARAREILKRKINGFRAEHGE